VADYEDVGREAARGFSAHIFVVCHFFLSKSLWNQFRYITPHALCSKKPVTQVATLGYRLGTDYQSLTEHENVKDCMACDDLIRARHAARDLSGAHLLMFLFGVLFQLVIFKTVAALKVRVMGAKMIG